MGKIVQFIVLLAVVGAVASSCGEERTASSAPPRGTAAAVEPTSTPAFKPVEKRRRNHRRVVAAAATATPTATPKPSAFVDCDSNIRARAATTTCPFASNVFYEYYAATGGYAVGATTVSAWSPAGKQYYDVTCTARIVCKAGDGAEIRFPASAIESYDEEQAGAYADAHDVGPGVGEDDYPASDDSDDYEDSYDDDEPYQDESSSAAGENIPSYEDGSGYRVQCADGMFSKSGGVQGACSGHGGVG